MSEREERRPHALALEHVEAAHVRRQHLADDAGDLGPVLAVVAVVHFADDPVVGGQARDDGGALEHRVGAAAEVPGQRDVDGDGVDGVHAHTAHLTRRGQ